MPKRPFYVQSNGDCVPLEGAWRIESLGGEWYVLGHHSVVPCGSERAAVSMLAKLEAETDVDRLAVEAIEGLDRVPGFEGREAFDSDVWSGDDWTEHEPG